MQNNTNYEIGAVPSKLGGFFGTIRNKADHTIVYENYQPTQKFALWMCLWYVAGKEAEDLAIINNSTTPISGG